MQTYRKTIGLGIALVAISLGACAGRQATSGGAEIQDPEAVLDSRSATLIVHGMSCPLCANNVDKQLLAVPGVSAVNVDMGTGEAKVQMLPAARVTRRQLADAVYKSGFTLAEVRVP